MEGFEANAPTWPGWETVQVLGCGSFGSVYEIRREFFGNVERAALKVIHIPQSSGELNELRGEGYTDESIRDYLTEQVRSITDEYSLMRKLNGSSNVVNCSDVQCVEDKTGFGWTISIKMELLTPLLRFLENGLGPGVALRLGIDLCQALVLCRKHSIIHRDIKPANIFISDNGDFKLGDFGIAKISDATRGGTRTGTYDYMAPEVYNNLPYGQTVDIYSLGIVLYWLLNDRRGPFLPAPPAMPSNSQKEEARFRRFSGEELPPPAHGSDALKRVVLKACAFDPHKRYQSAEEMLYDLERIDRPTEARARPVEGSPVPGTAFRPSAGQRPVPQAAASRRDVPPSAAPRINLPPTAAGRSAGPQPAPKAEKQRPKAWILLASGGLTLLLVLLLVLLPRAGRKSDQAAVLEDDAFSLTEDSASLPAAGTDDGSLPEPAANPTLLEEGDWSYEFKDGVLTISGTGNIKSFQVFGTAPWDDVRYDIRSIVIEEGITGIGDRAFSYCGPFSTNGEELTVSLPSTLTDIGIGAFQSCESLCTVELPAGLRSIGEDAFAGCPSIRAFVTAPGSEHFTAVDGVLFTADMKTLLYFPSGRGDTSYVIPSGITAIGDNAFQYCFGLRELSFPEGLVSIGHHAFVRCRSLGSPSFPSSLRSIGYSAFADCEMIADLDLPDSVSELGFSAFSGCSRLESVRMSESLTELDSYTFENCVKLKSFVCPSSLENIGDCAFQGCSKLETIVFSDRLTSIGFYAFSQCSSLQSVDLSSTFVTKIDYYAFEGCSRLSEVLLPDDLKEIGNNAFQDCVSLKSIDLSETAVETIKAGTFAACGKLVKVTLPISLREINETAFQGCSVTDLYYGGTEAEWKAIAGSGQVPYTFGHFKH